MSYQAVAAVASGYQEAEFLDPSDKAEVDRMVDSGRLSEVEESALAEFLNNGGRPEHIGFGGQ